MRMLIFWGKSSFYSMILLFRWERDTGSDAYLHVLINRFSLQIRNYDQLLWMPFMFAQEIIGVLKC